MKTKLDINDILSVVVDENYSTYSTLTICYLKLKNGFIVSGQSACADAANFDYQMGRKIARENALNEVWLLEGYLLKQRLFELGQA